MNCAFGASIGVLQIVEGTRAHLIPSKALQWEVRNISLEKLYRILEGLVALDNGAGPGFWGQGERVFLPFAQKRWLIERVSKNIGDGMNSVRSGDTASSSGSFNCAAIPGTGVLNSAGRKSLAAVIAREEAVLCLVALARRQAAATVFHPLSEGGQRSELALGCQEAKHPG